MDTAKTKIVTISKYSNESNPLPNAIPINVSSGYIIGTFSISKSLAKQREIEIRCLR